MLITQKQLAKRWNMSPRTLERWRTTSNEGPKYIKIGLGPRAMVRYREEDILAFEAAGVGLPVSPGRRHGARSDGGGMMWQPIDVPPPGPCCALLWCEHGRMRDWKTQEEIPPDPNREARYQLAFWAEDEGWCEMDSGHGIWERDDHSPGWKPTHWMLLQQPPTETPK